jgi:dethiobiotin synthetase
MATSAGRTCAKPPDRGLRGVFVTGTGTEVGKTVVAAVIARGLARSGESVAVFKPAVTGLEEPGEADHELLRRAAGSEQDDDQIAPYRYRAAVSPHLAAELEGETIEPALLVERAREAAAAADAIVCEGVGGLLVPLTPGYLVRDLARELELPLVVAARPGLGTINHTLMTLEAARAVGIDVAGVVLTPWPGEEGRLERSNLETIAALGRVPVEPLGRIDQERPEGCLI